MLAALGRAHAVRGGRRKGVVTVSKRATMLTVIWRTTTDAHRASTNGK